MRQIGVFVAGAGAGLVLWALFQLGPEAWAFAGTFITGVLVGAFALMLWLAP